MTFSINGILPSRFRDPLPVETDQLPPDEKPHGSPSIFRRFFAKLRKKEPGCSASPDAITVDITTKTERLRRLNQIEQPVAIHQDFGDTPVDANETITFPRTLPYYSLDEGVPPDNNFQVPRAGRNLPLNAREDINQTPGGGVPNDNELDELDAALASFPDLRAQSAVANTSPAVSLLNIPPLPDVAFYLTAELHESITVPDDDHLRPYAFDPNAPSPKDPIVPRELPPRTPLQPLTPRSPIRPPTPKPKTPILSPTPGTAIQSLAPRTPGELNSPGSDPLSPPPVPPKTYQQYLCPYPWGLPQALPIKQHSPIITPDLRLDQQHAHPSPVVPRGQPLDAIHRRAALPVLQHVLPPERQPHNPKEGQLVQPARLPEGKPCILFDQPAKPKPPPKPFTIHHATENIVYELFYDIGRGAFGQVMLGSMAVPFAKGVVAVKLIDKFTVTCERVTKTGYLGMRSADIWQEHEVHRKITDLRSMFLAPLLSSFQLEKAVCSVMPLYSQTLEALLKSHDTRDTFMEMNLITLYSAQMLLGLEALHTSDIYHCDLKPENIFISSTGNLVLGDFGLALEVAPHQTIQGPFGTPPYSAPEVWGDFFPAMADIWSYGAIILQMLISSDQPYFSSDPRKRPVYVFVRQIVEDNPRATKASVDFVSSILNTSPMYRPTISLLKKHLFFSLLDWKTVNDLGYIPDYRPGPVEPLVKSPRKSVVRPQLNLDHVKAIDAQLQAIDTMDLDYRCPDEMMKRYLTQTF